jgi:hypothetical protein
MPSPHHHRELSSGVENDWFYLTLQSGSMSAQKVVIACLSARKSTITQAGGFSFIVLVESPTYGR